MMPMRTTIVFQESAERLYEVGARLFFTELAARRGKNTTVVALPGGRSIVGILNAGAAKANELGGEVWKSLRFFMVDERLVPLDHADSNFKLLNENFYLPLVERKLIAQSQVFPFIYRPELPDRGVSAYTQSLLENGGSYDISFLGVGEDAHVGALFPAHHSMSDKGGTYITMDDSPKPPPPRMTSSRALLSSSGTAFGLFTGEAKREALERFLNPEFTEEQCPAKLMERCGAAYALTDIKRGY
jgi:6-phosphogluconolactonase